MGRRLNGTMLGRLGLWQRGAVAAGALYSSSVSGCSTNTLSASDVEVVWPHGTTLADVLSAPRPHRVKESWPPQSGSQRFLEAGQIWFQSPNGGDPHLWEMTRWISPRTSASGQPLRASDVVAVVQREGKEAALVINLQWRPPVNCLVAELPAGMIDDGETAMDAAVRELKEESGLTATKKHNSDAGFALCYPDPWKSNENYLTCEVEIDGDAQCNRVAQPAHERDEHFAGILLVPLSALARVLPILAEKHGVVLETRLVGVAQGLSLASRYCK